jgi:hypothetical protein
MFYMFMRNRIAQSVKSLGFKPDDQKYYTSSPRKGKRFFTSPHHSGWVWGQEVKWLGHEADNSIPPTVMVNNAWSYNFTSLCLCDLMLN